MGTVLTCPECTAEFVARTNSAVYCGAACRMASYIPPTHEEDPATEYEIPKWVMQEITKND